MLEHELRRQVVTEMHLRKWPVLGAPSVIVQWVRALDDDERGEEEDLLRKVAAGGAGALPFVAGQLGEGVRFAWEKHSEGSNLALFFDDADAVAFLDPRTSGSVAAAIRWGERFPGRVVRATRIWLAPRDRQAEEIVPLVGFTEDEMVSCTIGAWARLWSDFRIQPDGYGRLIVASNTTAPSDLTRLVQKLQELGNYRNRALLGLPVAKTNWPRLNAAEQRLTDLIGKISDPAIQDDVLLEEISGLSIEIASIATVSSFRSSATAAYAKLVEDRLAELECKPVAGFPSLTDFTERRFLPAIRTCLAVRERTEQLSERANQFNALLRTRIETRIENQNGQLLQSMERSAARQVRLQELVEGLSIFALSYYAVGLLDYVLKGFDGALPDGLEARLLSALIPVLIIGIWLAVRRLKHRLLEREPPALAATGRPARDDQTCDFASDAWASHIAPYHPT